MTNPHAAVAMKLSIRSLVRLGAAAVLLFGTGCASSPPHTQTAMSGQSIAFDYYVDSCNANDADACANAARVLDEPGWKVHDEALSAQYFAKACNANPYYCGDLGQLYLDGKGVARDQEKGLAFFDRGCAAKNAVACHEARTSRQQTQVDAEKAKEAAAQMAVTAQAAQAKDAAPATAAKKQDIKKPAKKTKPAKQQ